MTADRKAASLLAPEWVDALLYFRRYFDICICRVIGERLDLMI